jgi:phage baseplate assembly protein W
VGGRLVAVVIAARAGSAFVARVVGFPAHLAAPVIGVQILADPSGAPVVARGTATVTEEPAGSGSYVALLSAPPAGHYSVFWDWDSGGPFTPSHTAAEDLTVAAAPPPPPPPPPPIPDTASGVAVPHFSLPFQIVAGAAAVNEQDSFDEIRDCAEAIARCPHGFRIEAPDFGVPDQAFTTDPDAAATAAVAAVEAQEPRTRLLAAAELASLVSSLTLSLTNPGGP